MPEVDPRIAAARRYVDRGWPVFVLGRDKRPLPNCPDCAVADWTHDRETCTCLHCHGFYAATLDLQRAEEMCRNHPGLLAVRTGVASGLVVIDAEGTDKDDDGQTGVELLEQWEVWSGGWSLPPTLQARNHASGGIHLYYNYPTGTRVRSRNRILPNVDIKSDGGYVAVPCGVDAREWFTVLSETPGALPPEAITWLAARHSSASGQQDAKEKPDGYSYQQCLEHGPGPGDRDYFFTELLFRLRKDPRQLTEDQALAMAYSVWEKIKQDPSDPWPFDWVVYKTGRTWLTVPPGEPSGGTGYNSWVDRLRATATAGGSSCAEGGSGAPLNGPTGPVFVNQPPPFETEFTDTGNVHRFARLFEGLVLFVPGVGWHKWSGAVWQHDPLDDIFDMTHDVLLQLRREQEAAAGDEAHADRVAAWYRASSSIRARRAIVTGAMTDPRLKIGANQLDADPMLFVVNNGTIDLRTRTLRSSLPGDHNTKMANVTYDPSATCPRWLEHMNMVSQTKDGKPDPNWIAFIQRWMGYTLTGGVEAQKFFFGFGGGNNGKNVMIETLLELLGDYAIRGSSKLLMGSGQEHETVIADLAGARMVFIDETPHGTVNEARLKELTGSSRIRARKIAKDSFEFDMHAKLWIAGNNKPRVRDSSDGFWRRLDLVPFDATIPENRRIAGYSQILLEEAPGILNWCLEGLASYMELRGLGPTDRVRQAGQVYRESEDLLEQFISDTFVEGGELTWLPNKVIHGLFAGWCDGQGIKQVRTMLSLSQDLERAGFMRQQKPRKIKWGFIGGTKTERGWLAPPVNGELPHHLAWSPLGVEG